MIGIRNMRRFGVTAAVLAAMACTPIIRNHGYVPLDEDLAQVTVGQDTRETVLELVGPPTSGGVLDGSGYYYVASEFSQFGALAPREVDREVVAISFSDAGIVTNVERFGLEDGRVIALSRRVTATSVRNITFLEQLFGSIGRVNAADLLGDG